ncbi:serine/threonine-protein kinase [Polaribacter glomeratus]|uniref:Protein kinase domain-containing protein n=1 Tax=Polaribacter glomeratus TaxID=102 RepID=A0A2S7WW86_9FLAO|nr:serine/threonine-protein kinase [Polaribacter glomeratus]PQJ81864.1 hypothetical protein BTO16_04435 [Polaribacter glomeratus]TXD66212.1 serine/threonine protein kinase [Polaribacter glomeratus]
MTQQEFRKRYEFDLKTDNIGGGSFGTVYKAYDTVLDREVAIKVSEVKMVGDKEFSLLEEYKAIENLTAHKNIANYEKVFRFESFPAIYDYGIMQYYSLGNLSHYLKNNEVSLEKRDSITKAVLEGIGFLHQHKVVHRDLKPSNILVVDRRGKIIPKITDFGLSKQAEGDGQASRFTNSFAGGTLQYSSPEQLKGLPLKLNTDLWSFGAIAYEILTGKTLFEADSQGTASAEWQNTITQKILHADITEELQTLPTNWQKVVRHCLERDVYKRAQDTTILFSILNGDENLVISSTAQSVEKKIKNTPVVASNDATIIKGKEPKEKKVEIVKNPIATYQKSTISKVSTPQEKIEEKFKEITQNIAKTLNIENQKLMLPLLAAVVVLIVSGITYFMFSSDTPKQIETKLSIFKEGNFYGYKEGEKIVIAAKYLVAENFATDVDSAKVATKDSSFYINKKGIWLTTITDSIQYKNDILENEKEALIAADKKAWEEAKRKNSKSAYQKYLSDFKNGVYEKNALAEINRKEIPPPPAPEVIEVIEEEIVEEIIEITKESEEALFLSLETAPIYPGCKGNNVELRDCMTQKVLEHFELNFNKNILDGLGLSPGSKRVYGSFQIFKSGKIGGNSVGSTETLLSAEAKRVLDLLPRMRPAILKGKPISFWVDFEYSIRVE